MTTSIAESRSDLALRQTLREHVDRYRLTVHAAVERLDNSEVKALHQQES